MAMIVEELLSNNENNVPNIYLLNSHGITNFERAVVYATFRRCRCDSLCSKLGSWEKIMMVMGL